jgi:hypothetical protein
VFAAIELVFLLGAMVVAYRRRFYVGAAVALVGSYAPLVQLLVPLTGFQLAMPGAQLILSGPLATKLGLHALPGLTGALLSLAAARRSPAPQQGPWTRHSVAPAPYFGMPELTQMFVVALTAAALQAFFFR